MKDLVEFVKESYEISEAVEQSAMYLIDDFHMRNDETLLSAEEYWESSKKLQNAIALEDLKRLYEWCDEHSDNMEVGKRHEPLVANYQNKPGNFAFRRWVLNAVKDLGVTINGKESALYHNTILKGNYYFPSAAEMEEIIALAYNNVNDLQLEKDVTTIKRQKHIQYYNEHKDTLDAIAKELSNNPFGNSNALSKLQHSSEVTEWYKEASGNSKPNASTRTPKTDLISADEKMKISIKKAGGSQLMSGMHAEACAVIKAAVENAKCEGEASELLALLKNEWISRLSGSDSISDIKKDSDNPMHNAVIKAEDTVKQVEKLLNELVNKNTDFRYELLKEAITGNKKFGVNSKAAANFVFMFNEKDPKRSHLYDIDSYINHIVRSKITYFISFKSANSTSWQAMRIVTGTKDYVDDKISI